MSRICLIRHGSTEASERHLYYGATDVPVSPGGVEEAGRLAAAGGYPPAEKRRIYTSGMLRTEQTLRLLYGEVPHTVLPDLAEMRFGIFEMRSYEEMKDDPAYQAWISGDFENNVCPGGESAAQFIARVTAAFRPLLAGGDAIVICHGGVIAALMQDLFPGERENMYRWQPGMCRGYEIRAERGIAVAYRQIPEAAE